MEGTFNSIMDGKGQRERGHCRRERTVTLLPLPKAQGRRAEGSALGILRGECVPSFPSRRRSWTGMSSVWGGREKMLSS